jgi:enterochelin esterase-like enzyme
VAYGPWAINTSVQAMRFGITPASATESRRGDVAQGHVEAFTYDAPHLGGRPEVAQVYLPPGPARRVGLPVAVFLHGIPGAGTDWLVGGGIQRLLDDRIASGRLPRFVAVFPTADGFRHPEAGWRNVADQRQLGSIADDLLPVLARQDHLDLRPHSVAVVGVGRGADGALAFGRSSAEVGFTVAIHPRSMIGPWRQGEPARFVEDRPRRRGSAGAAPASTRWAVWRSDLPAAFDWLARTEFGRTRATAPISTHVPHGARVDD